MIDRKYFNVTMSRDMIAQAYQDNESHNSYCFLVGPVSNNLPTGFRIINASIVNGSLQVEYENNTPYEVTFYIEEGNLYCRFMEGGNVMALVDLGNVMGPPGETGPAGNDGISPTFVLGDGTGGTVEGHLYADYDNPYIPTP